MQTLADEKRARLERHKRAIEKRKREELQRQQRALARPREREVPRPCRGMRLVMSPFGGDDEGELPAFAVQMRKEARMHPPVRVTEKPPELVLANKRPRQEPPAPKRYPRFSNS